MFKHVDKNHKQSKRRSMRVRQRIHGTAATPRLSIFKSNNHIQAQLIDDDNHITLGAIGTCSKEFRGTEFAKKNRVSAKKLGEKVAEIAKAKNIKEVIFDRGPYKYHGILAELANAARAGGLQF
jgi:large subunit ribosomal protein L18